MKSSLIIFEPPHTEGMHAKIHSIFFSKQKGKSFVQGWYQEKGLMHYLIEHLFLILLRDVRHEDSYHV